ncbi:hypothetical protein ONE63_001374 [Megalurothrips usitatus]|uniref:Mitochondrial carrier homolog 2-like n=1 Tax=Megalurothrips usitatus TaxID=439358 RepID=A0AAV7XFM1_9NEOP|nr:hypothetical protein ONE63_001374 [Megalurothrips usitatus]
MGPNDDAPALNPADRVVTKITLRSFAQFVFYPVEYGRTLIQLGHEPIAPWPGKSWSGQPRMHLPNIFQYVGHIKARDGMPGIFRGVKLRLVEHVVGQVAYYVATDSLPPSDIETKIDEGKDVTEEERRRWYLEEFLKAASGRSLAVIVSHPFHVCAVRCMAQYIGQETKYGSVFGSLRELYRESGVLGFFSGLVPRLLADICQLAIWHSLTYALTTYVSREREHRDIFSTLMGLVASTCTYPLLVVSNCMCVSGSGLAAAQYPNMRVYSSWVDCWRNLAGENQLWRGSSIMLWRYDTRVFK